MDEMDGVDAYKREQGLVVVGIVVEFLAVVSVVGLLPGCCSRIGVGCIYLW